MLFLCSGCQPSCEKQWSGNMDSPISPSVDHSPMAAHGGAQSSAFLPQFCHPQHWCNANKCYTYGGGWLVTETNSCVKWAINGSFVIYQIEIPIGRRNSHRRRNIQQNYKKTFGPAVFPVHRVSSWLPKCSLSYLPMPISSLSFLILQLFGLFLFFFPPVFIYSSSSEGKGCVFYSMLGWFSAPWHRIQRCSQNTRG